MKAAYFLGESEIDMREVADPTPGPGEVILQIEASGMCGSDLKYYRARDGAASIGIANTEPVIAGHEPCGTICAVGPAVTAPLARTGNRVMVHHYDGCGSCQFCHTGWTQMCDEGSTTFGVNGDGAHAEFMRVPVGALLALPDPLSAQTGAAISCGTGTAFAALERLGVRGEDTVAIFGQGPVGLSATQLGVAMGARVIALDIDEARLRQADALGADVLVDVNRADPVGAILEATGGRGASCSMETSAASTARTAAIRSAAKWGRVAFVGEGGEVTIDVSTEMNRKQLSLFGLWTLSRPQQAACARFIAEREIDVDLLFTHSWPLSEAVDAYELFATGAMGKGFLVP